MPQTQPPPAPSIFCRSCGYDLHAQPSDSPRCPECGHPFDPARPATFRTQPPRHPAWRWVWRAAVVVLLLVMSLAGTWAWLARGWYREQAAMRRLGAKGDVEPLGGWPLRYRLGRFAWVLERERFVVLGDTATMDLSPLRELPWMHTLVIYKDTGSRVDFAPLDDAQGLRYISFGGLPVDDAAMVHIGHLQNLERLDLSQSRVSDTGVAHLRGLSRLRDLDLSQTTVGDAGLEQLAACRQIDTLKLSYTRITDAGMAYLKALPKLRVLHLDGTSLSDAGIVQLKEIRTLEVLVIAFTHMTGDSVEHLKCLNRLKELNLIHDELPDDQVKALQTALPTTHITR